MSKLPTSPETCMAKFRRHLESESVLSPMTIEFYHATQHAVTAILRDGGRRTLPYEISEADIRWLMYEEFPRRRFTFHTQRGYIFALYQLMQYYNNNAVGRMKIKWPNNERPNVDWLTFEEAEQLLRYQKDPLQNMAIHLMLCMGLRKGECMDLQMDWIHDGYIHVLGKGRGGGKWRPIPYHRDTSRILAEYMSYRSQMVALAMKRRPSTKDPPELFITNQLGGRIAPFGNAGDGWDRRTVIPLREKLGFHFTNHTLRRTFGRTMYYIGKTDIVTLARIMGHESTSQTLKYIGTNMDEMSLAMTNSPF